MLSRIRLLVFVSRILYAVENIQGLHGSIKWKYSGISPALLADHVLLTENV